MFEYATSYGHIVFLNAFDDTTKWKLFSLQLYIAYTFRFTVYH